jgi:tetratricopeptide (TPR) repeat protein
MSRSTEPGAGQPDPTAGSGVEGRALPASVNPWILNSWQDLLFFVATPLLIIPLVACLRGYLTVADIALYVVSFGALGHHLPGMLRAYGDRELFRRFRVRFIVAPLFLLAVCGFFAYQNLNGLMVMALLWGIWHGAAQVYGFLRIYDSKVKSFSPLTARLDMAMCIAWFGLGPLQSPDRMDSILRAFYDSGGPLIPAPVIHELQYTWAVGTGFVTAAFVANVIWQSWQGCSPSTTKLLLMITSFSFWWYTMVGINNIILGVAMFEIFHDMQYLAIVWVYNVKRVQSGYRVGAFTRFLFRRSWSLVGLYVGLVFAYGYVNLFTEIVKTENVKLALFGMVTASGFLHFYYDGFIWKVREKSTRQGLGLSGGQSERNDQRTVPSWLAHALYWSLFVVPVALLGTAQWRGVPPTLERELAILRAVPKSGSAHVHFGDALAEQGDLVEAQKHYEQVLQLGPSYATEAHNNWGNALQKLGHPEEAVVHYQEALRIQPDFAEAHNNWGTALQEQGHPKEAIARYQHALRIKPDYAGAHYGWGSALQNLGHPEQALAHYQEALRIKPDYARARGNLGYALAALGRFKEALSHFSEAVRRGPQDVETVNNLAWLLATCPLAEVRDGKRALQLAGPLAELQRPGSFAILDTLAAAYAEVGSFDEAVRWQEKAVKQVPIQQQDELQKRLELYRQGKPYRQTP